jgi:rare lipoprotein A
MNRLTMFPATGWTCKSAEMKTSYSSAMERVLPFKWIFLATVVAAIAGCSSVDSSHRTSKPSPRPYKVAGKWYQPQSHAHGFQQKGIASWYGKKFHGRKTSNGETYDMYGISAAHKTLPFNTVVRVHNLDNGKKIDVRINDRGPFVRGRIIDLSYGAAQKVGLVGPGTARVKIVALGAVAGPKELEKQKRTYVPVDYEQGVFTFQVGAFRDKNNAEKLRAKLDEDYQNAHITTYESPDGIFYRVRVGRFTTLEQARRGEEILIREGFDPIIVAE